MEIKNLNCAFNLNTIGGESRLNELSLVSLFFIRCSALALCSLFSQLYTIGGFVSPPSRDTSG